MCMCSLEGIDVLEIAVLGIKYSIGVAYLVETSLSKQLPGEEVLNSPDAGVDLKVDSLGSEGSNVVPVVLGQVTECLGGMNGILLKF